MGYFDQAPTDLTLRTADIEHGETLPGIDMLIELADARCRHIGQGVLELEDLIS